MPEHIESRTTSPRRQLTLPGQAHTAEGPHDQTGMYVMHHALRRDVARFVAAVQNTPISEHAVWTALLARWLVLSDVLHHHHSAEDAELWPLLQRHAERAGAQEDLTTLADMEAEHERLDAALTAGHAAFSAMSDHPCTDHRNALEIRLSAAREALLEHLAHEETQALPMLQRTLSEKENQAFEKAVGKHYPLKMVPFLLPWVMDEVPDEARERLLETTPPGYALLLRLLRGRFERGERRAFRYA
ncbi:hemerythrin domain-containing protein [Nocardioides astragali]|uniref:Hemerythrin domain-containing protein n=1 Tax=Nocardioides astragali TaxID=1776736 RepID=A0ABW2N8B3_9ACTN|nr:hemerythrin domain-containing protein [Nocardioides astragali]